MAKNFKKREITAAQSLSSLISGKEPPIAKTPKKEPEPQKPPAEAPATKAKREQPERKGDKRLVEDKKVRFTNMMRASLRKEMDETIADYRQKVDYAYGIAQFLEDAIAAQIKVLNNAKKGK